jgi:hypothetical protein
VWKYELAVAKEDEQNLRTFKVKKNLEKCVDQLEKRKIG